MVYVGMVGVMICGLLLWLLLLVDWSGFFGCFTVGFAALSVFVCYWHWWLSWLVGVWVLLFYY